MAGSRRLQYYRISIRVVQSCETRKPTTPVLCRYSARRYLTNGPGCVSFLESWQSRDGDQRRHHPKQLRQSEGQNVTSFHESHLLGRINRMNQSCTKDSPTIRAFADSRWLSSSSRSKGVARDESSLEKNKSSGDIMDKEKLESLVPISSTTTTPKGNETDTTVISTFWEQLQSIPNMLTLSRMACTPIISYWICLNTTESLNYALVGCFLAATSDFLDGYIAKHHQQATPLGTYLDPLADKVVINGLACSLWIVGALPTPLVALWIGKDVTLIAGTGYVLYQSTGSTNFVTLSTTTAPTTTDTATPSPSFPSSPLEDAQQKLQVHPSAIGKVNTALQFITIGVALVGPVLVDIIPTSVTGPMLSSLCWMTGGTTIASIWSYGMDPSVIYSTSKLVSNEHPHP